MSFSAFSEKVKAYLKAAGYSQKMLANELGLDPSLLSHKLNGTGRTVLTYPEIREIIKVLASQEVITRQAEALELLASADCPNFSQELWKAAPLNKLEVTQFVPSQWVTTHNLPTSTPVKSQSLISNSNGSSLGSNLPLSTNSISSNQIGEPVQKHNLPQQLSSFIGRDKEVAELKRLLIQEKVRLVSLVGAGGCGKTRLSLKAAAALLDYFIDGVWFVELAPLSDPNLVAQTIATTLGISEQAGRPILLTVSDYLRSRHVLLVLDNCEHLVEECARIVDILSRNSSNLHILTTSRETLGLTGEVIFRIPSLSLPDPHNQPEYETLPGYEGVSLFIERAAASNPDFSLTPQNAPAVVQVCRELDGIPLAIELAAARIKVLKVEQVASRLVDRFNLLRGGSRTALPRQQTLKGLVDWSYGLLTPPEKRLLARLSVFAGGWTLNAAETVCGGRDGNGDKLEGFEVLDALSGLVNKSLVQVDENKDGIEARYSFLETIRQYGLEKLKAFGEEQEIRYRHLIYFSSLAKTLDMYTQRNVKAADVGQLETEIENLRTAIDYGLKIGLVESVYFIANNSFWDLRGYYNEGRYNLERLLAHPGMIGEQRGFALFAAGLFATRQADLVASQAYAEDCLRVSKEHNNKLLTVCALTGMGLVNIDLATANSDQGSLRQAKVYFEQALELEEGLDDMWKAMTCQNLGLVLVELGEYPEAELMHEKSDFLARKIDFKPTVIFVLGTRARMALVQEEYEAALIYLVEMLKISEEIEFHLGKADAYCYLGFAYSKNGNYNLARQSLETGLKLCLKRGQRNVTSNGLVGMAALLKGIWNNTGQTKILEQITSLCGSIKGLVGMHTKGQLLIKPFRSTYEELLTLVQLNLEEIVFNKAFENGMRMTLEEAVTYALNILAVN